MQLYNWKRKNLENFHQGTDILADEWNGSFQNLFKTTSMSQKLTDITLHEIEADRWYSSHRKI